MQLRINPISVFAGLLSFGVLGPPVAAHTVKAAKDVAVMFHLEPNHNPKAGEPAQAWFVLTQTGGQVIPLEQCNCRLNIYNEQQPQGSAPVLNPPLQAVSAERFQGIPGAEIVFPEPGVYQLELEGQPQSAQQFQPFQIRFAVTVATGTVTAQAPKPPKPDTKQQDQGPAGTEVMFGGAIAIILGLVFVVLVRRRSNANNL